MAKFDWEDMKNISPKVLPKAGKQAHADRRKISRSSTAFERPKTKFKHSSLHNASEILLSEDPMTCEIILYQRGIFIKEKIVRHWALGFLWADGEFVLYEANDFGGMLAPYCTLGFQNLKKYKWATYKLATIKVTKKQVHDLACENSFSDTEYNFLTNNCRDWVVQLSEDIGIEIRLVRLDKVIRILLN